ncbi:MAG: hypothetical protein KatS3mg012_0923 [Gaiellaceae bacterium]|nr:MAG: hypothetical protein KatS3mg012_0923 [Gaiellaceae bacterium]
MASSGGHLLQLVLLARRLPDAAWTWVTFDTPDARFLLDGRKTVFAHHPTNRNLLNLVRNLRIAVQLVRRVRPSVLVTTGAGVAVPFCWVAKLFGARIVYVESLTRISSISLSARLVHPIADHVFVQWPGAVHKLRKAEFAGSILSCAEHET